MSRIHTLALLLSATAFCFSATSHAETMAADCITLDGQLNTSTDSGACGATAKDQDGDLNLLIKGSVEKANADQQFLDIAGNPTTGRPWNAVIEISCAGDGCAKDENGNLLPAAKVNSNTFEKMADVTAWVKTQVAEQKNKFQTKLNMIEACLINNKGDDIEPGSSVQATCFMDQLGKMKDVARANDYYMKNLDEKLRSLMVSKVKSEQDMGNGLITDLEKAIKAREAAGFEKSEFLDAQLTNLKGIKDYRLEKAKLDKEMNGLKVGSKEYAAAQLKSRDLDIKAGKTYFPQGMEVGMDPASPEAQVETVTESPSDVADPNAPANTGEPGIVQKIEENAKDAGLIKSPKRGGTVITDGTTAKPAASKVTTEGTQTFEKSKAMPDQNSGAKDGTVPAIDSDAASMDIQS